MGKPKEEVEQDKEKQVLSSYIELRKKITEFYYQPDVSYTCPGKNDYVIVRQNDGSKVKAIKYILVLTLSEGHSEFLRSEPGCQVSFDIFTKLRPANVLLRHSLPKNVCVCLYHANINFIITSLHKQLHRFPSNHRELLMSRMEFVKQGVVLSVHSLAQRTNSWDCWACQSILQKICMQTTFAGRKRKTTRTKRG